jgi:hypothetical protein
MKNAVFWDMTTPCGTLYHHEYIKSYIVVLCARLFITFDERWPINNTSTVPDGHNRGGTVARHSLLRLSWGTSSLRTKGTQSLSLWRWRRYVPLKRRFLQGSYDVVISQKTAFFNSIIVSVFVAAVTFLPSFYLAALEVLHAGAQSDGRYWVCTRRDRLQGHYAHNKFHRDWFKCSEVTEGMNRRVSISALLFWTVVISLNEELLERKVAAPI